MINVTTTAAPLLSCLRSVRLCDNQNIESSTSCHTRHSYVCEPLLLQWPSGVPCPRTGHRWMST
jgi:hypothetical protein